MLWQGKGGNRAKAEYIILFCEGSINKLFLRITKIGRSSCDASAIIKRPVSTKYMGIA